MLSFEAGGGLKTDGGLRFQIAYLMTYAIF